MSIHSAVAWFLLIQRYRNVFKVAIHFALVSIVIAMYEKGWLLAVCRWCCVDPSFKGQDWPNLLFAFSTLFCACQDTGRRAQLSSVDSASLRDGVCPVPDIHYHRRCAKARDNLRRPRPGGSIEWRKRSVGWRRTDHWTAGAVLRLSGTGQSCWRFDWEMCAVLGLWWCMVWLRDVCCAGLVRVPGLAERCVLCWDC